MSCFGQHWRIDGVIAGPISRGGGNGRYRVLIEREFAELPAIEAIDWTRPTIEHLRADSPDEFGLPEGYGFQVEDITYDNAAKSYTVELQTERQYLGDVTGYQSQIEALQAAAVEKDAVIAEKDAAIQALEAAGTAETVRADLQAAYTEGVESNG